MEEKAGKLTLKYELSISACPMDRFGVGGRSVFSGSASVFLGSFTGGGSSFEGVNAPHMLKLSEASRHCSMMYGKADSLRLPIICLDISKPANC
jgi:hypothetical protein